MKPTTTNFCLALALLSAPAWAQSATLLLNSGSAGAKKDLVIIGDGFTAAEQSAYNGWVDRVVMRDMFSQDVYREAMNAFNIWRVNVNSIDSGVTQVNSSGVVTTFRRTALDYRYSGVWSRCWMEPGPNTSSRMSSILSATVPGADYVFIVLNESRGGGCRRGNTLAVTTAVSWTTCAHEMGHMVGNLGDEYFSGTTCYSGGEPAAPNLTREVVRSRIKWNEYIPGTRPVPTLASHVGDPVGDVGLFQGGTIGGQQYGGCIYRPTLNSRMRSNRPEFCPVGYEAFRDALTGYESRSFVPSLTGDFNGDNKDDMVLHSGNSLHLFLSDGGKLESAWSQTGFPFFPQEFFMAADFDGDGMDDLIGVFPGLAVGLLRSTGSGFVFVGFYITNMPGWQLRPNDRFHVGDFDNDGRDDLFVFNGSDWSIPYLAVLTSTGTGLRLVRRYDANLPGWQMARDDRQLVGDFNGDGRDELAVFNGANWSTPYLGVFAASSTGLDMVQRYDANLPGWQMARNDEQFVGDFDNDGRDDLYVFNGRDWSIPYLGLQRSTGSGLTGVVRYQTNAPGWQMARSDRYHVGDVNGDGRDDLVVYNTADWATEYLGILRSTGNALVGSWQSDWVGTWNLGPSDRLHVANFSGGSGWDDVVIYNDGWLGLLRSFSSSFGLSRIYPRYVRNVAYHRLGWW